MKRNYLAFPVILFALLLMGAGCLTVGEKKDTTSGPAGVFVSTNRGDAWKQISLLPEAQGVTSLTGVSVYRLFTDPQDAGTLYWSTRGNGLLYSYDDGGTWKKSVSPLDTGFIYSVAVHPEDKCVIYATNGRYVYKTEDCSRTWTEVYRETRANVLIVSLDINSFAPHQIYMALSNGDFFQSVDLGQSWKIVRRFKARLEKIITDRHNNGNIFIATRSKGLVRSTDAGENWEDLGSALSEFSQGKDYRRFFAHPTEAGTLFWISQYGILVSNDSGSSWKAMNLLTAPGSVKIYGFAIDPQNSNNIYYTGTSGNRSTFYRTVDGGKNWITKKLPSGQLPTAIHVHPEKSDWVYVGFTIPPQS
ncbi:MAG: hypothetical protein ABII02_00140 [Candidatus Magasanikbacteria bacterium]